MFVGLKNNLNKKAKKKVHIKKFIFFIKKKILNTKTYIILTSTGVVCPTFILFKKNKII